MIKRDALLALSSALNDLIFLLRLDTKCPWTLKFEADCVTANELLENGFSDDELMQLVVSIKYVYQGMGSFNDYSPGITSNGMDAHFLIRHQSAKVVVALLPLDIERGIQNEDYDNWH